MQLLIKNLSIGNVITNDWIVRNCYIAGACVSNATRQQINDVDIYFKTKKARDFFINQVSDVKYISKTSNEWKALICYDEMLAKKEIEVGDDIAFDQLGFKVTSDTYRDVVSYELYEYKKDNRCVYVSSILEPLFKKQEWMFNNGYDFVLLDKNHFDVDGNKFYGNKSITFKNNELVYQFILRFYGSPKEMMDKTFDFQHCKIAYDLSTNIYIASQETWESLSKRELVYVNSFYPISSLKRLYKYGGRGYKWNNDVFVKIIRDIHNVDTDNKFVLEDQLIGYYEDFDYNIVFNEREVADFESVFDW